jgi:limonene-1,2-epoxide hydrolase
MTESSMTREEIKTIARTYFDAWRSRDFDRFRTILADDVSFRGVLGTADGAEDCIAGLRGMSENIMTDIDIQAMAVDGSDVLTWFDLHTRTTDPLPTVNWSHIENGLITRIRVTFDPRPLFTTEAAS